MNTEQDSRKVRAAIEAEPLPQAGESLRRQLSDVFLDRAVPWALTAGVGLVLAGLEWLRYLTNSQPTIQGAIAASVVAVLWGLFAWRKARRAFQDMEVLKKGLLGERHVGHYLDDVCRGMGYRVLHDIKGDGFNVDHVLIGPGGVFSVETKYRSKPAKGTDARMTFDGVRLTWPDKTYDEKIAKQARANADFVAKVLEKRVGKRVMVRAVVVLPGWYIEDRSPRPRGVWVLADRVLHRFLEREYRKLPESEVGMLYESLAEYSRNKGK